VGKVVASIEDAKARKTVADSMAKLIRRSYGITPSTPRGSYAAINAVKQGRAAKVNDAAVPRGVSSEFCVNQAKFLEARQKAYDARNPHINKEGK
jgi:hypothetical protein